MKKMIYLALATTLATTPYAAKAFCGELNTWVKGECSKYGWTDPLYWQCKSLQLVAGGICQAVKFQLSDSDKIKPLQDSCSSDPRACADALKGQVKAVLGRLETEESSENKDFQKTITNDIMDCAKHPNKCK